MRCSGKVRNYLAVAALALLAVSGCTQPTPFPSPVPTLPPATPTATPTPTPSPTPAPTRMPTPTPLPTRPSVAVPQREAAYRPAWGEADLRGFDSWGDAGGDAQDLIAVYFRPEGDRLRFRADILDLQQVPDLYLALDGAPGGTTALAPGGQETSDLSWDLLVKVSEGNAAQVLTPDFHSSSSAVVGVYPALDYVTVDLRRDALPSVFGDPFQFQVLAVSPDGKVLDRTTPVSSSASVPDRARLVIRFGNVLGPGYPYGVASWYDTLEADRDGKVKPKGWRYLLDAAEKYWVPITLDVKQTQYLGSTEDLGLYDRLRAFHQAGLLDMPDTLGYGHFMAWQPQDVDAKAIALSRRLDAQLGLPASTTFVPYEGQITVADLQTIKEAGYETVTIGTEQEYYRLFGESRGEAVSAAGKLHRANGINLLFQRFPWSFVWDPRWGDNPYAGWDESDIWRGTDGGLHLWFRRNLLDLAQDPDQEQAMTLGTDINVTPWGFAEVVDANLRWIVEHPWIKVMRTDDLFHQGWKVIDHGDLKLPPEALLLRFPMEGDMHYNAYFPQYYYGGIADGHSPFAAQGQAIESYADYVPYWRDGLPIPSGRKMGDDRTPGTIVYETLRNLRSAPDNDLTTLAWLYYFNAIGEQTLHTDKDLKPHDPALARAATGGAYVNPGAKMRANVLRQVNKVVAAALWAEASARGAVPTQPAVEVADLDLDGEAEYVLRNDRLFLVFEDDGGRLEYGFLFVPGRGAVQFIAPKEQFFPGGLWGVTNWDWTMGEAGQDPTYPTWAGAFIEWSQDGVPKAYLKYTADVKNGQVIFTSPDGKVRKSFSLDREGKGVLATYQVSEGTSIEVDLALDPGRMETPQWSQGLREIEGSERVGMRYLDGLSATLTRLDGDVQFTPQVTSFLDSPARWEWRHDPGRTDYPPGHYSPYPFAQLQALGQGQFTLRLGLEP